MVTARDRDIVEWVGRLGAASAEHVMARFGMGRTAAYRRLSACVAVGVLEPVRLLHGRPALYVATREGLRWVELTLRPARLSPGGVQHATSCADVAVVLHEAAPHGRLVSDRELRSMWGSAHRPDFVWFHDQGSAPVAVEVELSVKGARRLDQILRNYARHRGYAQVLYLVAPAAGQAVRSAVERARADDIVTVEPLPHLGDRLHLIPAQGALL